MYAHDDFAIDWLLEDPFWGRLCVALPSTFTSEVDAPVLAPLPISSVQVLINPDEMARQSIVAQRVCLQHEMLHLLLGHPFQRRHYPWPVLFDLAADLEVAAYLPQASLLDIFQLDIPPVAAPIPVSAWEWYQRLYRLWQQHLTGEEPTEQGAYIAAVMTKGHPALYKHRYWPEISRAAQAWLVAWQSAGLAHLKPERDTISRVLWERLKEATPSQYLPDWRRLLQLFEQRSGHTRLRHTLHRPSKRYGTRPGIRVRRQRRLWVAVDTSGSIQQEDLHRFFEAVYALWKTGAELEVLECDERIQRRYRYTGISPQAVKGRGNTRFDPVLEAAAAERPDGLVFFTDGLAPVPQACHYQNVLWMIAPAGIGPGHYNWHRLPGQVARMEEQHAADKFDFRR